MALHVPNQTSSGGMTVVYALEAPPETYKKSLFLAGPTPRVQQVPSYRPIMLGLLEELGYDGVVFVPEPRNGTFQSDYTDQLEWEEYCLNLADVIVFWVPRDMASLPALTTNDEWGYWKDSGKVVFGAPEGAASVRYQQYYAEKLEVPQSTCMLECLRLGLARLGEGAVRTAGEREVPLHIWRTTSFQAWYASLREAGNVLVGARQKLVFYPAPQREVPFLWVLHVNVYITGEDRNKTNEFVVGRPDIACILVYRPGVKLDDTQVVLVREFRSPGVTKDGYVHELPGGSSFNPEHDMGQIAANELYEETGLLVAPHRFYRFDTRQLAATLASHRSQLFAVLATEEEMAYLKAQAQTAHGVEADSERTYVEVTTLGNIRRATNVDWSMLGMIMHVVAPH